METHDDHRTRTLKDRKAGRLFTGERTKTKIFIETIIRSMAMTMRVLLRCQIGTETFNIWMVICGFLWIRLCLTINAAEVLKVNLFDNVINFQAFESPATSFLNVYSVCFILAICWYHYITEIPIKGKPTINVLSRGESVLLAPIIRDDKLIIQKEAFVQSAIEPALGFLLGFTLLLYDQSIGAGIFFTVSSVALSIDETRYHRAVIRLDRIRNAHENSARKKQEKKKR